MQNNSKNQTSKKILEAAINVGGNSLRLAIALEYFVFPFFCFWFMEHSLNVFKTWKTFEYFIFASCFAPAGAILLNEQSKLFNKNAHDEWKIYDPKLYSLLPFVMGTSEKNQMATVPFSTCLKDFTNVHLWINVIKCDIYWLLLMSPLLFLAWTCRKTAKNILKNTLDEEKKNELREIIAKNI